MSRPRKIIHIDQDCFYAAVEIRDNPSLKGKPVAVGGSSKGRGVLTTASYEARKFGVKSAMATAQALKLCPDLILVPVHFDKYRAESKKIRKIFSKFTKQIEPLSLDEAYLDVSDCSLFEGSATLIAQDIRQQIYDTTGLTASAGIAPNKFLAKVASDWKKPNGQFTISPHQIENFVKKLKIEKIPGVGRVTAKKMHSLNIYTCEDLQKLDMQSLSYHFGSWGVRLYDICRGIDERIVSRGGPRKSLSVENTFNQDLETLQDCLDRIPKIFQEFIERLEKSKLKDQVQSLVVKVKFHDFTQTTMVRSQEVNISVSTYQNMVAEAFSRGLKPVRLLGLGVKFYGPKKIPKTAQLPLF